MNRDVICVLGMHSSGTSSVAAVLQLLGVHLGAPDHFMPVPAERPKGFYENSAFVGVNERLLARLGGSWLEPPRMPVGWEGRRRFADLERRAHEVVETEFEGRERWGWKDPRNSLTLPFWQRVVPDARYVICIRHPFAVARSLGDMESVSKVAALWTRYMSAALRHTAGRDRHLVFYEELMLNPQAQVERLAVFVAGRGGPVRATIGEELGAIVDTSLWHHREPEAIEGGDEHSALMKAQILYSSLHTALQMNPVNGANEPSGVLEAVAAALAGEATPRSHAAAAVTLQGEATRTQRRLEREVGALGLQVRRLSTTAASPAPASDEETAAMLRAHLRHRLGLEDERKPAPSGVVAKPSPPIPAAPPPAPGAGQQQYADLVRAIRAFVESTLPGTAKVAVVSRGDDDLLKLGARQALHFPQDHAGVYAGHHPGTAHDAIELVEAARERGATHLLFPATALWWLDHYKELATHLKTRYSVAGDRQGVCMIFSLEAAAPGRVAPAVDTLRYQHLVRQVRLVVDATLPEDADVLVVSKGDDHLLELGHRRATHFPQTGDGVYAGHHPATGAIAIEHLRALYEDGARYLVLPSTSYWWLSHYTDFAAHLEQSHRLVARQENVCYIYELLEARTVEEMLTNLMSATARLTTRASTTAATRRAKGLPARRGPHAKGPRRLREKFRE